MSRFEDLFPIRFKARLFSLLGLRLFWTNPGEGEDGDGDGDDVWVSRLHICLHIGSICHTNDFMTFLSFGWLDSVDFSSIKKLTCPPKKLTCPRNNDQINYKKKSYGCNWIKLVVQVRDHLVCIQHQYQHLNPITA